MFFLHLFLLPDHVVGKLWIPLGCLEDVVGPVHQGVPGMIVCVLSHINFIIPGSLSEFTVQRDAPVPEIPLGASCCRCGMQRDAPGQLRSPEELLSN